MALTRPRMVAVGVFFGTLLFRALDPTFTNDHFYWIAGGRQILVYGELPFRDFHDPGYFLQHFASAGAQLVFGYNLFGELLLSLSLISLGTALVFLLAQRASGSIAIGLVVSAFVVAAYPRLYNYHKVSFFVFGLLLIWRYVDRRRPLDLWLLAGFTAFAFLFRHDYGLYIGAAACAALFVLHRGDGRSALARRLAVYGVLVVAPILPFFVFVQANGGLAAYFGSSGRFGTHEQARGGGKLPPSLVIDPAAPLLGSAPAPPGTLLAVAQQAVPQLGTRPLPGLIRTENAAAWLYYVCMGLPYASLAFLWRKRSQGRPERLPGELPKLVAAAVLCATAVPVLLRYPLLPRFADVAAPLAVIGAWLMAESLRPWRPCGSRGGIGFGRLRNVVVVLVVVLVVGLSAASLAAVAEGEAWLASRGVFAGPRYALAQAARRIEATLVSPPIDTTPVVGGETAHRLMHYVHTCSGPADRLVVTLFGPEFYFYTGRVQPRPDRIETASIPIILTDHRYLETWDRRTVVYRELAARHYREVWSAPAEGGTILAALIDTRRVPTGTYAPLGLPCFR